MVLQSNVQIETAIETANVEEVLGDGVEVVLASVPLPRRLAELRLGPLERRFEPGNPKSEYLLIDSQRLIIQNKM